LFIFFKSQKVKNNTDLALHQADMLVQTWRLDYTPPCHPAQLVQIADLFEGLKMKGMMVRPAATNLVFFIRLSPAQLFLLH
jgi:hypothetical protein